MQYKVRLFSQYVLRTPLFPVSFYLNLLDNYSSESLLQLFKNPFVREAIRIASPELLTALDNWRANPHSLTDKKKNALVFSLLKYIARMSARCTPFGLFAGCTLGKLNYETNILLVSPKNFRRHTQFDMQFWVAMLQEFASRENVKPHLKYYPNNSIYALGDFYRYIEYKYVKTKREHSISALRKSPLLESLLIQVNSGLNIQQMVDILAEDDSEKEEALKFVNQLIDFQFLVSELDASLTGSDEWERVFSHLSKITALKPESEILQRIKNLLFELDKTIIPKEKTNDTIKSEIKKIGVDYDDKYLLQTDLYTGTIVNTLSDRVSKKVLQAISFLNGIQKEKKSVQQLNFIKAFTQRYEAREMSLATVLDTETGIGYLQNSEMNDTHDLLEKFSFKRKDSEAATQSWTAYDYVLEKKIKASVLQKEKVILLSENDFPDFDSRWENTPATFSVMIGLLENEEIVIESSGNVSAAKLLGRFCNGNTEIYNLTNEIVEKEKEQYSEKIMAEIVHISESRTGNILRRPVLRAYEITYLSNPGVDQDFTIGINDLTVSVINNRIVLRSKKHNKEVIPCLSNAHNYSYKSLPIYHFLCDLHNEDVKPVFNFSWGILESHYDYFPRVYYKEVLLSRAKWIVSKNEIETFFKLNGNELLESFSIWRKQRKINQFVSWVDSDNTLLIDLEKVVCIALFLKSVKNYDRIILEEFLFSGESVVKNITGENFTNELILSFYKEQT
ncbi:lantibiotic dehydratase family protein [Flavobacterium sp. PL12]|uniref:lantibiotic dehydratase family protein n=1 Tax=Flavobacterium sp. PL12 TaxID=3071718 RepID=UPI00319E0F1E